MDGTPWEASAQDSHNTEVSGPLEFRRLQGNKRCSRCRELERDCYLERGQPGSLHCLTCTVPGDCRFQRVVVKEGLASTFTWQELIGDDVATSSTYPTSAGINTKKRPYAAIADSLSHYGPPPIQDVVSRRNYTRVPSSNSEAASQIPTNLSISPFATRKAHPDYRPYPHYIAPNVEPHDIESAGAQFKLDSSKPLELDDPWATPYNPAFPPAQGWPDSISQGFHHLAGQLEDLFPEPQFPEPQEVFVDGPTSQPRGQLLGLDYGPPPSKLPRASTSTLPEVKGQPPQLQCPTCLEKLNTNSEYRKHMARHTKPFVCNVPGCARAVDGFATRNDLDRHKASVHDSSHAPKMYRCGVPGCRDPHKVWSRKDNFKAHIKRMHPGVDADECLERSVVDSDTATATTDKP